MAAYTTINNPADFFSPTLYTGTGSALTVTGVGFQSDCTWLKDRSAVQHHQIFDSVRGGGEVIYPNLTNAEATVTQQLNSWNSDGFVLGNDGSVNTSSNLYASWNWKAGTTSGIATNGSTTITPSSYSFNQTAGISIIKYVGNLTSGAKLAHGLGATPSMVIFKMTNATKDWLVYHKGMAATAPEDYGISLNTTAARVDETTFWNDTAPDSVNFTLGNTVKVNGSGDDYIAYCFVDVKGYSKFGQYIGNGNAAKGQYINVGFRPAFVLMKRTDGAANWVIWDDKRDGYNTTNDELYPNTTAAEGTGNVYINFLSNGFRWLTTDSMVNGSGDEYIYAAFAHSPFTNSEGIANNAR